jgi:hypothetical protein
MRRLKQIFEFQVGVSGESDNIDLKLDDRTEKVTGVLLSSDRLNQIYARGRIKLDLNGREVYPENFPARQLISNIATPPDQRFNRADWSDLEVGNKKLTGRYTDVNSGVVAFAAYTVTIVIDSIIKD